MWRVATLKVCKFHVYMYVEGTVSTVREAQLRAAQIPNLTPHFSSALPPVIMGAQQTVPVPERLHVTADDSRVPPDFLGLYEIREAKVNGKAMWQKVEGADSHGVDRYISSSSKSSGHNWLLHHGSTTGTDKAFICGRPGKLSGDAMTSPHEISECWETLHKNSFVKSPTLRVRPVGSWTSALAPWSSNPDDTQGYGMRLSADEEELHASVKAVLQHGQTYTVPRCHSSLPWPWPRVADSPGLKLCHSFGTHS